MVHLLVIACFAVLFVHDSAARAGAAVTASSSAYSPWLLMLGCSVVLGIAQAVLGFFAVRSLERTGSWRTIVLFDRGTTLIRTLAILNYAAGVMEYGWADAVRGSVGNLVLLDELLIVAPVLLVVASGWYAGQPIDLRLREARLIASLDQGKPYHPPGTRWSFTVMQIRHQMLLGLAPIAALVALRETAAIGLDAIWSRVGHQQNPHGWTAVLQAASEPESNSRELVFSGVLLMGVLGLLVMLPLSIRVIWDAVPVSTGEQVEGLLAMARRHGVRVRNLLIWRTQGSMINGAVIGLFGPARHILLTDALLESLPDRQVKAVLAHELGHIRKRHVLWLGVSTISIVTVIAWLLTLISEATMTPRQMRENAWVEYAMVGCVLLIGGAAFGWISRRFEWQADAFAAAALSTELVEPPTDENPSPAVPNAVTEAGAMAMIGALDSVARLNHIPIDRRSFRHGSIARRIENLRDLIGTPLTAMPIDRTVRTLKIVAAVLAVAAAVLIVLDAVQSVRARRDRAHHDHAGNLDAPESPSPIALPAPSKRSP